MVRFKSEGVEIGTNEDQQSIADVVVSKIRFARPFVQFFAGFVAADIEEGPECTPMAGVLHTQGREVFNILPSYGAVRSWILKIQSAGAFGGNGCVLRKVSFRQMTSKFARVAGQDPNSKAELSMIVNTNPFSEIRNGNFIQHCIRKACVVPLRRSSRVTANKSNH